MKTIVVATDLTGQSEAALEYARKLAGGYGARIVLAHGTDPVDYAAVDSVPGRVLRGMTEEARTALEKLSGELLREGIPSHSEIRQGVVAEMLVAVAKQYEAGLIVIGTRGMQGAGGVIVGAIAEQLVRLECGRVSACSRRAGAAGDGTQRSGRISGGNGVLAGRDLSSDTDRFTCQRASQSLGIFEHKRHHAGGVRHSTHRAHADSLRGKRRQSGRCDCGSDSPVPTEHSCCRREAFERIGRPPRNGIRAAGALARSRLVRSA